MTRVHALKNLLIDGEWHPSSELARVVGHRFGAAVLLARKDGFGIDRTRSAKPGEHLYRFVGYRVHKVASPRCCDCGSYNIEVLDVRPRP
jgi:hypothetical protein